MHIVFPPEPELNKVYDGEVVNITKFGAFVNIMPGRDGLLHISKLDDTRRVERVEDYLELGQKVPVLLEEIDRQGKLALKLVNPSSARRAPAPRSPAMTVPHATTVIGAIGATAEDRGGDRGDRGPAREGGNRDRGPRPERRPAEPVQTGDSRRKAVSFEDVFDNLPKP